jgi:hypothetical protein
MDRELMRKRPADVLPSRGQTGYLQARTERALRDMLAARVRRGEIADVHSFRQAGRNDWRVNVTLVDHPRARRRWGRIAAVVLGALVALFLLGWLLKGWVLVALVAALCLARPRTTIQVIQSVVIKH